MATEFIEGVHGHHGLPWFWSNGIPHCQLCFATPEPAVPADPEHIPYVEPRKQLLVEARDYLVSLVPFSLDTLPNYVTQPYILIRKLTEEINGN